MKDFKKAESLIEENKLLGSRMRSWGPRNQETLSRAAKILEIVFPETYSLFLKKYGTICAQGSEIHGLTTDDPRKLMTDDLISTVVSDRSEFGYPHHVISLEDIGEGSTYCLDLSQMNDEGECPVVVWPAGGYEETPVLEIEAEDFGAFFLKQVEEQIRRINEEGAEGV